MNTLHSAGKLLLLTTFLFFALIFLNGAEAAKPLKVFILAGLSNMQGHAKVSTFEHIGMDPATARLAEAMAELKQLTKTK